MIEEKVLSNTILEMHRALGKGLRDIRKVLRTFFNKIARDGILSNLIILDKNNKIIFCLITATQKKQESFILRQEAKILGNLYPFEKINYPENPDISEEKIISLFGELDNKNHIQEDEKFVYYNYKFCKTSDIHKSKYSTKIGLVPFFKMTEWGENEIRPLPKQYENIIPEFMEELMHF